MQSCYNYAYKFVTVLIATAKFAKNHLISAKEGPKEMATLGSSSPFVDAIWIRASYLSH